MNANCLKSAGLFVVFLANGLFGGKLFAQKEYEFNAPGSSCYMKYVAYAPDYQYNSRKRPLIICLPAVGQSPMQAWERDSLRFLPEFNNYFFVYIPNSGGDAIRKLSCLPSLTSLLSFNYEQGKRNLFLKINDSTITRDDVEQARLGIVFKSIRLWEKPEDPVLVDISDDFKAVIIEEKVKQMDEVGTYYTAENFFEEDDFYAEKPVKTYFGPAKSWDYTLTGIIRDKSSGEALPFATINVKGASIGATTNANGKFTIHKVPSDTSTLVVRYIGYEQTEVFLTPTSSKSNLLVDVPVAVNRLSAVTITGSREQMVLAGNSGVSAVKMTPRKLEQLPNLGEKDIMRSFQLMPGVSASNESSSGLYVRGGTPDQNLVLYDGFTVYQVDHLYGFYSAFNSHAIKDVQLFKGGFEPRFGGRLSSVTEITGKDGNHKRINAGVDLSLLSVNGFIEVPVGSKFTSVLTARRSYKGPLYEKIFEKFNESKTTQSPVAMGGGPGGNRFMQELEVSSYFYDLNGKFTYRPSQKDIISLSLFNGTDMLDNGVSMQMPSFGGSENNRSINTIDLTTYGNTGGSLRWSRQWSPSLYGNTLLGYSNYFSNRERSQEMQLFNAGGESETRKNGLFENNDLRDYSFKSDYQWDVQNFAQLQFGVFSSWFDIDYTYAQSDTLNLLEKRNSALLSGGYTQMRLQFAGDKITLLPGVRASHFSTTNKVYFEPRASASFNLSSKLNFKGAWGKYYQFASRVTREDIMSGSKDFWMLSDGNSIPVSSAIHYTAGLSFENNALLLSAEAYYKELENLTEYSLRFNPNPQGVDFNEDFFTGDNYSRGLEFLAQKKSGRINGWVSYTLGESRSRFERYSDDYFAANQNVTHEFKIVGQYNYKRWDFAATWVYATGRPYTAPSGAYVITLLDGTEKEYFTVTSKNQMRLPDYHRMDLSVNYKLLAGTSADRRRREIGYLGVSLFNVYNRTNVWYKQFMIDEGQIVETNVNYLGITPNLTLSLKLW